MYALSLVFATFTVPFIRGFATVARPLNELTRKDAPWTWDTRQQQAFATLKHRVTSEPILAQPVLNDQFDSRSRCLRIRCWSGPATKEGRWKTTPCGVLLGNPQRSQAQLRHLQFRALSHCQSPPQLATPTCGIATRHTSIL
jgi:hypothetical protein